VRSLYVSTPLYYLLSGEKFIPLHSIILPIIWWEIHTSPLHYITFYLVRNLYLSTPLYYLSSGERFRPLHFIILLIIWWEIHTSPLHYIPYHMIRNLCFSTQSYHSFCGGSLRLFTQHCHAPLLCQSSLIHSFCGFSDSFQFTRLIVETLPAFWSRCWLSQRPSLPEQ